MKKLLKRLSGIKKRMGKWFWVTIVLLIVVIIVLSLTGAKSSEGVSTVVQRGTVTEELILTGQVKASKHAILYFPTSGKISWVGVKEGDKVRPGQWLVSLDKTTLNSTYQQALNTYRNYQASAENVLDSVKDHSGDETYSQKATRTSAEVARDNAYDAVTAAEYNLRNATITAPFSGIVTSLSNSNPGINVMVTEPQVELLDPSSIYFEVGADQSEVINVKDKQNVEIVLDSYREIVFSGTVSFVGLTPKANETGTVYIVKVMFDQNEFKESLPRMGMSGDAKFILSEKEDTLLVPARFINTDKDGKFVNLGKIGNKVRVTTGIEGEDNIEILTGIKEGDVLFD